MPSDVPSPRDAETGPRVFIGSSSTALPLARNIGRELAKARGFTVKVWDEGILQPGDVLLDGLLRFVTVFDFAILVLSADDVTSSKGTRTAAPRDNVVFELGMFMGVLGRRRAFPIIVLGQNDRIKLPSDLDGLLTTRLQPDALKKRGYLASEVAKLKAEIEKRWKEAPLSLLPSTGLAHGYLHNFLIPVHDRLAELEFVKVAGKEVDVSKRNYDFTVLVPRLASQANVKSRTDYVRELGLESVSVEKNEIPPRRYSFFVDPKISENGKINFFDYPTTLRSSYDAIMLVLRPGAVGEGKEEGQRLEEQEARNFVKALKHLFERPEAGALGKRITFRWVDG